MKCFFFGETLSYWLQQLNSPFKRARNLRYQIYTNFRSVEGIFLISIGNHINIPYESPRRRAGSPGLFFDCLFV